MTQPQLPSKFERWFEKNWDLIHLGYPFLIVVVGAALMTSGGVRLYQGWGLIYIGQVILASRLFFDPARMTRTRHVGQMVIATVWNVLQSGIVAAVLWYAISIRSDSAVPAPLAQFAPVLGLALIAIQVVALPLAEWWNWFALRTAERELPPDRRTFSERRRQHEASIWETSLIWKEAARLRTLLNKATIDRGTTPDLNQLHDRLDQLVAELKVLAEPEGTYQRPEPEGHLARLAAFKQKVAALAEAVRVSAASPPQA